MLITLEGGRAFPDSADVFPGCPEAPFSLDQLRGKFLSLAKPGKSDLLFDALVEIASVKDLRSLWNQGSGIEMSYRTRSRGGAKRATLSAAAQYDTALELSSRLSRSADQAALRQVRFTSDS